MNKRAVEIARDVILQLKKDKIRPFRGMYIGGMKSMRYSDNDDFKEVFNSGKMRYCTVCALGALIISYVSINDELTVKEVSECRDKSKIGEVLKGIFSSEQVSLIEKVFEHWTDEDPYDRFEPSMIRIFYEKYSNVEKRLVAIMRNIIRNKGEFIFPRVIRREARRLCA